MKTYYIFRHALSTHSTTGYGEEIVSAHILPEGRKPIENMAQFLKTVAIDFAVSSQLVRCLETTDIVQAVTKKEFTTDQRINEYSAEENYSNESFESFRQRLIDFLLEMEQDETKQTIAICTHGAVIAGIKHILTEGRFTTDSRFDFPKPGVLVTISPNGTIEEKDFNE